MDRWHRVWKLLKHLQPRRSSSMPSEEFILVRSLRGSLSHLFGLQATLGAETDLVDPDALGNTITGSFVVGLRSELAQLEKGHAKLPLVGVLDWTGKKVELKRDDRLAQDAQDQNHSELLNYLVTWPDSSPEDKFFDYGELQKTIFWRDESFATVFERQQSLEPYPGQDLITAVCSLLIRGRMKKDPDLRATLLRVNASEKTMQKALITTTRVISFLIHDAICAGRGITIETIGTFQPLPSLDFVADERLLALARAWRREIPPRRYSTSLK